MKDFRQLYYEGKISKEQFLCRLLYGVEADRKRRKIVWEFQNAWKQYRSKSDSSASQS